MYKNKAASKVESRKRLVKTMKENKNSCKAQSVLGPIDANALGITLPHEHIFSDARKNFFFKPTDPAEKALSKAPVTLENLFWIRANALSNLDCLQSPDETILAKELLAYKKAGGSTIIDVSTRPVGGDNPLGLQRLARATGLNIIMGTGYYMGLLYSPEVAALTEKQISDGLTRDLTEGVGGTGVRAGIIGEIGLTPALREDERRLLRACAAAQNQTGAPISIHPPGLDDKLIQEILNVLRENGGRLDRTVICHIDIMGLNLDTARWIADAGCYIEFDTFGHLFPPFLLGESVMSFPSESQRINAVMQLVSDGYLERILLSHDTFLKVLLTSYGGFGYAHILRNIVPVMLRQGATEKQVNTIIIDNPGRLLSFINDR
jgi:phosphotriesterase-related protein